MELSFDNLDQLNATIRGTVAKGTADEWIYQRAPQGQIKYKGPKVPTNPRTRPQQINRLLFRYASAQAKLLTPTQKAELINEIREKRLRLTWRTLFLKKFLTGQWPP
jgi:hypothetical protein